MAHMTSGLGGLAPFFRRFLPLFNGYTTFFQPYFGHLWPLVNGLFTVSKWVGLLRFHQSLLVTSFIISSCVMMFILKKLLQFRT